MRFQYTPEISLGSLAQIATIIIGCVSIYVGLRSTDIEHSMVLNNHTEAINEIKSTAKQERSEIKLDIKEINNNVKALDNKITEYTIQQNTRDKVSNAKH